MVIKMKEMYVILCGFEQQEVGLSMTWVGFEKSDPSLNSSDIHLE
jgi:hypothetical protein